MMIVLMMILITMMIMITTINAKNNVVIEGIIKNPDKNVMYTSKIDGIHIIKLAKYSNNGIIESYQLMVHQCPPPVASHLQQRAALGDHRGRLLVPGTGEIGVRYSTASIIWLVSK